VVKLMKKLLMAAAVCALVVGLTAVPAAAVKSTKQVGGTVNVFVAPNPVPDTTTTVTASGNVGSNSGCRKDRDVTLTQWFNTVTAATIPVGITVETGPNGDYTATLPKPTPAGTYVLQATVGQEFRRVGSKKKGKKAKNPKSRQFNCLAIPQVQSSVVTVLPPPGP
jgi:hypothetical protein